MITYRIASLLLAALILINQSAASEESKPAKYRVELNSGERFVVYSGELTPDSLIGKTFAGKTKSIPNESMYSLERSAGTYSKEGAISGGALGFCAALLIALKVDSDADARPYADEVDDDSNIALKMGAAVGGGTLLGLAIGTLVEKWKPVYLNVSLGSRSETDFIGFQFGVAF